ncbi:MAG: hypothetical protein NVSMB29_00730 [Candidatus Dormibacteria bacterium]
MTPSTPNITVVKRIAATARRLVIPCPHLAAERSPLPAAHVPTSGPLPAPYRWPPDTRRTTKGPPMMLARQGAWPTRSPRRVRSRDEEERERPNPG